MKYIGIDPGQRGAVCVLNDAGHIVLLADLPQGAQGLTELLKDGPLRGAGEEIGGEGVAVCVEYVESRPTDGLRGLARFMRGAGIIEGVCTALFGSTSLGMPRPQVWRRAYQLRGRGKAGSVRRARGLAGPGVKFRRHDEAEAYLLARFAWLNRERWGALCVELRGKGAEKKKGAGLTKAKRKKSPSGRTAQGKGKGHATQKRVTQDAPGDTGCLVVEAAD